MLQIQGLTYRIGDRVLFDNASVTLPPGQRVGFVGRNGAGKSTLLGLITGALEPEAGTIRKEFAESIEANSVHGSDAPETAAQEVPFFFSSLEIVG